jgi:peroxiredoxin
VILERLDLPPAELERRTGWTITPQGACRAHVCVPLDGPFDVRQLARRLGMALVHDERHGLWGLGPQSGGHALASAELPDIVLPDRDGSGFALRSLHGRKTLMITWASWCGCRSDLPGWRKLREELNPQGLEIVTVALDTGGRQAAGPWIDRARSTHPALIDEAHLLDELLGVVNVPSGVWIDEEGRIVRPPEPAFPWWPPYAQRGAGCQAAGAGGRAAARGAEDQDRAGALCGCAARLGATRRAITLRALAG